MYPGQNKFKRFKDVFQKRILIFQKLIKKDLEILINL
jgi:hypothetical protein